MTVIREVWVDANNDPDPGKLGANGITVPYLDARWVAKKSDPLSYLKWVRALPGMTGAGLYLCDPVQWTGIPTDAVAWADWAYDLVQKKCAPGTSGDFPRVDLNYEQDSASWLIAAVARWRQHSPRRSTSLVVQARKASIYASIIPLLNAYGIRIKPECYIANYERVESAAEVDEWRSRGAADVLPMIDGAQLGAYWQGSAFTMGRIS